MVDRVEAVVIGAGVVGLAVARRLAMAGREVIVLEAADAIGTETSSRNSEVIHAGIYYPKDSWKARFCVAGKTALYKYCQTHGVEHQNCGKFIVATNEEQIFELERLKQAAATNGVPDLEWRTSAEVSAEEPAVFCVRALWSPSTGIIDSHGLMLAYQGDAEEAGAMIAFNTPVESGSVEEDGILLSTGGEVADNAEGTDCREFGRAACAKNSVSHCRYSQRYDPALLLCQRELLLTGRQAAF